MNKAETIREKISILVPDALTSLDLAENPTGSSWLDIEYEEQFLTIECKPSLGFGLYSRKDSSYGSGPDEVYRNLDSLIKRISMLLLEQKIEIRLKEVRELLGKTQNEFSLLSGQKQPSISKIENRADLQLSSIEKFITGLGGSLEITAHFDEFDVPIDFEVLNKSVSK